MEHKQELAIVALCSEPTITRASEVSNVSRTTIYEWLSNPEFKLALLRARANTIVAAGNLCTINYLKANEILRDVMDNPGEMPVPLQKLRMQASRMVIAGVQRIEQDQLLAAEAENVDQ